jgi:integrase
MGLTVKKVERLTKVGRHLDGRGLYLQISKSGGRSWIFRYEVGGKETAMGLGPVFDVGLEEARELARQQRLLLRQGIDPLTAARQTREANRATRPTTVTFEAVVAAYFEAHGSKWKDDRSRRQIINVVAEYATPILGSLSITAISTADIIAVLEQEVAAFRAYPAGKLWTARAKTARSLRGHLEAILDFATVRGHRKADNCARWKGHLESALIDTLPRAQHHPAMPYVEVPAFLAELRAVFSTQRRALEFTVLTATRTGEVLGAKWSEVDIESKSWTIPAERMKGGKEHVVPLTGRALEILQEQPRIKGSDCIFAGSGRDGALSARSLSTVLSGMRDDYTVHGMRSSFRDWCGERTSFPADIIELCLAHAVGGKVERAYARSTLLEKRRTLMRAWDVFCRSPPIMNADIVPLRA